MNNFTENLKEKATGLNFKKIAKVSLISLASLGIVGGGAAFAYEKYENSQEAKARAAQTAIVQNQAKEANVTIKSEDEIKNIVSQTIGVDVANITFEEIYLTNGYGKDGRSGYGKERATRGTNSTNSNVSSSTDSSSNTNSSTTSTDSNSTDTTTNTTNNSTTTTNVATPKYVYKVDAVANSLEYDIYVDGETGKVLSTKVDNDNGF